MRPLELVKELNSDDREKLAKSIGSVVRSNTVPFQGTNVDNVKDAVRNAFPDRPDISDEDIEVAVQVVFDLLLNKD